ncbi:hypothetical protein ACA910_001885 [Epithemia clementina (nom. ined.)]
MVLRRLRPLQFRVVLFWKGQLVRLCFLCLAILLAPRSVQGECNVHDEKGKRIALGYLDAASTGVDYNYEHDRLKCFGPNSCRKWTIIDCFSLQCSGEQSCQGAKLTNNQGISCQGAMSCQDARIFNAENVACGGAAGSGPSSWLKDFGAKNNNNNNKNKDSGDLLSCNHALIEIEDTLLCFGRNACVSQYEDRITVQAGAHGVVRCGSGNGEYACQYMVVDIKHAHRACFVKNVYDAARGSKCAVVCEGDGECNKDTIRFRVQS